MTDQVYNPGEGFRAGSRFGNRPAPGNGGSTGHKGMDYPAPAGTKIPAAADGVVVNNYKSESYGFVTVIKHNINGETVYTAYGHQQELSPLKPGDSIKQGETVGKVGSTGHSTGNHLHFEVIKSDPNPFSAENRLIPGHQVYNPSEFKFPQTRELNAPQTPDMHYNGSQLEPVKKSSLDTPDGFKPLGNSADTQTRTLYAQAGIDFADGGANTVAAITYLAAQKGITEIEQMTVKNGQIHIAQKDPSGFGYTTASIDAVQAANTDYSKSIDGLAALSNAQKTASLTQEQNQTIDQPVKARSIA